MNINKKSFDYKIPKTIEYLVLILLFSWILFVSRLLVAQPVVLDSLDNEPILVDPLSEVQTDLVDLDTLLINTNYSQNPYVGIIFGRDMDFEKAFDMHYPYRYGAYIDEVETGSPAERAGIQAGDIITQFGGNNVKHNDHFISLVDKYHVGDSVSVYLFRDENIMKTCIVLDVSKKTGEIEIDEPGTFTDFSFKEEKKVRPVRDNNDGILAWNFTFYVPDNRELYDNFLLGELGYPSLLDDRTINDQIYTGLNMTGFQLSPGDQDGSLRWGFFWANNHWNRSKTVVINAQNTQRNMTHSIDYYGITLEKQAILFDWLILSTGVLAGGMTTGLDFYQVDPIAAWDQIGNELSNQEHYYLSIEKKYYLCQPNIALTIPILGEIGLQFKLGYFIGIPRSNSWRVSSLDGKKDVLDSPDSSIGGYTFSFGPAIILR